MPNSFPRRQFVAFAAVALLLAGSCGGGGGGGGLTADAGVDQTVVEGATVSLMGTASGATTPTPSIHACTRASFDASLSPGAIPAPDSTCSMKGK